MQSMPYLNRVKQLESKGIYHIYARGVNKTDIFKSKVDYYFFIYLLKRYLTPNYKEKSIKNGIPTNKTYNSVNKEASLYAYALMKNHFHLLCKNKKQKGIQKLMSRVLTTYVKYFNLKYKKEGPLIQGSYRAVKVNSDEQFIHVSRYIHTQAHKDGIVKKVIDYKYSSYKNYLYNKSTPWLKINTLLHTTTNYSIIEEYSKKINKDTRSGFI